MPEAFAAGYTSRDVAQILGMSQAQVRAYVRAGFLEPQRGPRGQLRFSLQDLVLLRTAKGLAQEVSPRKLKRALRKLREQLPSGRPLTGVRITAVGDEVVVREGLALWKPESGQRIFDFAVAELASKVAPHARRAAARAREAEQSLGAEDWYELACELEVGAVDQARDAYRRVLELAPNHGGARVNLGRLLHEAGHPEAAETHYRMALAARPQDAVAAFNLGVALEDLRRHPEAVEAYQAALLSDAHCADAHYNLAGLFERAGDAAAAIRHLKAYRKLTQGR